MALTPLMEQYHQLKKENAGSMLFFRLGDFYEMFGADAQEASRLLGLVLTARADEPMCGVPYHSANAYITKLLKAGKKIAICEQTSSVADAKTKLFERKVVRVITPGTILEDAMLDAKTSNYLVAVSLDSKGWGLACLDVSTAEFWITQNAKDADFGELSNLLGAVNPSEIIIAKEDFERLKGKMLIPQDVTVSQISSSLKEAPLPEKWPLLLEEYPLALQAAFAALGYITANNASFNDSLVPGYREISKFMQLDANAVNTLELIKSPFGGKKNTLWGILDYTQTPMGSRLLKQWILHPLLDDKRIAARQSAVGALMEKETAREKLSLLLSEVCDIQRIMSRIASSSASPRDLAGLRKSMLLTDKFYGWLNDYGEIFSSMKVLFDKNISVLKEISNLLFNAVSEEPPVKISDGGFIRRGYNKELDELYFLRRNADKALQDICKKERQATGINSLKVGFNSVFGYYIEVSKINSSKVPYNYVRKQTLANAERFITEELKELEKKIFSAEERCLRIELSLFEDIKKYLFEHIDLLRQTAQKIAEADVLYSLAICALNNNYVCPRVTASSEAFLIEKGRHPVVEQNVPGGSFVPNDLALGGSAAQIIILTGPNMGGKSVYLKQNALITIMAQLGSFVPAARAQIPLCDKILTRIGAQDALSLGQSTFMVEMRETANILATASPATLVLLDEVGRGTSTFDGISIAWAITEFLYKHGAQGPKVLFATHYFELTKLGEKYEGIRNFHVDAAEYKDAGGEVKLNFLFEVKDGAADRSYGIHVAEIAGLPQSCILRAKKILKDLGENQAADIVRSEAKSPNLFENPILEEIKMAECDKMTPLQALQVVEEWKKRLK